MIDQFVLPPAIITLLKSHSERNLEYLYKSDAAFKEFWDSLPKTHVVKKSGEYWTVIDQETGKPMSNDFGIMYHEDAFGAENEARYQIYLSWVESVSRK